MNILQIPMTAELYEGSKWIKQEWGSNYKINAKDNRNNYMRRKIKSLSLFPIYYGYEEYKCDYITQESLPAFLEYQLGKTIETLLAFEH